MAEKEYIEREAAIRALQPTHAPAINEVLASVLRRVPAADVVEVRHGRWINERWEGLSSFSAECSLCGKRTLAYFHYCYCPNCGAKMEGGQDE